MKKLSVIIIFFMVLVTTSCISKDEREHYTSFEIDYSNIQLINIEAPEHNRVLSNEQAEYMNLMWENSEWLSGVTKTLCSFRFESNGVIIRYSSEAGVFIDDTNERHIIVSKEQRDYINSFVIGVTSE